ncbi:hypothetical protein ABZV93_11955, partial [Actinopolymorpha sp. NPDC004070]
IPPNPVRQLAAGGAHSLALTTAGDVLAWGDNADGQLGNGSNDDSNVPVEVDIPPNPVRQLAAGGAHSLALTTAGDVLAWGDNADGQLGNGSNEDSNVPVEVDIPPNPVRQLAAGGAHSLALTTAGDVLAWGDNEVGQLGNGSNDDSNIPVEVDIPGDPVRQIAAGDAFSLALSTIHAWGAGAQGQLGNGHRKNKNTPVRVDLPSNTTITAIAAGGAHALAITGPPGPHTGDGATVTSASGSGRSAALLGVVALGLAVTVGVVVLRRWKHDFRSFGA